MKSRTTRVHRPPDSDIMRVYWRPRPFGSNPNLQWMLQALYGFPKLATTKQIDTWWKAAQEQEAGLTAYYRTKKDTSIVQALLKYNPDKKDIPGDCFEDKKTGRVLYDMSWWEHDRFEYHLPKAVEELKEADDADRAWEKARESVRKFAGIVHGQPNIPRYLISRVY